MTHLVVRAGWRSGVAFALAAAPPFFQHAPASLPVTELRVGSVVEREMAPGDVHRYAVELRSGEYLQVLVEQYGIDVVQTLTGPDGAVVLETDSPAGPFGPDPLAVVARQTGVYELSLRIEDASAPLSGRYHLRAEAIREPSSGDLARVKAVEACAAAWHVFPKDGRAGLEHFRASLEGWEAVGDRRMQMWMQLMVAMGLAEFAGLDREKEAQELKLRALATALELGDDWAEARVRHNLAQQQMHLGQTEEAKANFERALALHRAAGRENNVTAARTMAALGELHSVAAEPQVALDYLQDALRSFQAAGNASSAAWARNQIGATYNRLGDPDLALEQHRLALQTFGRATVARANSLRGIALSHSRMGDFPRARESYDEALRILKKIGNQTSEGHTYLGLGDVHVEEGDVRGAAEMFASALAVYRAVANPLGETAAQCRLGEVHRRMGNRHAARTAFEAALAGAPRRSASITVCADEGLAQLALDDGEFDAAQAHAQSALAIAESSRATLASPHSRAAALASRQPLYELMIDILMRKHEAHPSDGHDVAAFELSEWARARSLLELLGEGRVDVRRGVTPELLAAEQSVRRRLNTTASAQAEALAPGRAEGVNSLDHVLDRLSAQLAETEARIRRASPQYAALTQAQPLKLAEIRSRVLDPNTQLLQYALGEERSYLWVASSARLESFRLAPRAEIEAAARRVHELMSTPVRPGGDDAKRPPLQAARSELSRLVLEPAARALTARRLLVVAPGALQYVPLGALTLPDQTGVLARFEVAGAPSASVIATQREEGRSRARKAVAVFADPVFERADPRLAAAPRHDGAAPVQVAARGTEPDGPLERPLQALRGRGIGGGLGRLPFTRQEADAIGALVPANTALKATGFEASREAATSPRLGEYRIVHFATHGVLNARRPELSGLVLSLFDNRGRKQDGFLRLHDVYNLRLDADLVVLSGCQTALGKDLRGEGLVGLTRGFMYAGARSVVASLWQVDDESTAELMKRFYRGMLKEDRRPAEALRIAQLEMSHTKRWAAPFYWAGFVIQGEWR